MKRVLLLMIQPPGGTGVQGLRYAKLFPHTCSSSWELHFAGPDPALTSVGLEPLQCPRKHCHYSRNISSSQRFATLKNRQRKYGLRFLFYGLLQWLTLRVERWRGHDSFAYLRQGLEATILQADRQYKFDLIAAKSPDFRILELGAALAQRLGRPLLAIYDDPHGQRDEGHFYPDDSQRQRQVLHQAAAVLFMSPLTRDRYVEQELVQSNKTFCLTDSYPLDPSFYGHDRQLPHGLPASNPLPHNPRPNDSWPNDPRPNAQRPNDLRSNDPRSNDLRSNNPKLAGRAHPGQPLPSLRLVHMGNLPEWRPIDPLLEALADLVGRQSQPLQLDFYGYLYPRAQALIHNLSPAGKQLTIAIHGAVDHLNSHRIAAEADILLVMIGPRHLDNQPSKFFVYLGHHKPVLVIGPPGNPIQALVEELGIGVFCDVHSPRAICDGLLQIMDHYSTYQAAFTRPEAGIRRFAADAVAADLLAVFEASLEKAARRD